jgi:outer membrane protein OmpA-like peptidoglycan-associated protein
MPSPASEPTEDDPVLAAAITVAVVAAIITSIAIAVGLGRNGVEPTTVATTTTTSTVVTAPPTTVPRPPAPVGVSVVWTADGRAEIRGTVQSDDQFEAIVAASAGAFGVDNIDQSRLGVDDSGGVNADEQIGVFVSIIDRMSSRLAQGVALLQDQRLRLSGILAPGFGGDVFDDLLVAATDAGLATSTDLVPVSALSPFDRSIEVTAAGVVLTGNVSSAEEAADLVAAVNELGLGEVRDELVVTEVSPVEGVVTLIGELDEDVSAALRALVATDDGIMVRDQLSIVSAEADAVERLNELFSLEPVLFDTARATIRDESAATLDRAAEILSTIEGVAIRIDGHTDSQGDPARNLELSQERAEAVLDALVLRGVDLALLEAQGFGESRPIADNTTAEGRQANRRIELTLLGA